MLQIIILLIISYVGILVFMSRFFKVCSKNEREFQERMAIEEYEKRHKALN